MEPQEPKSNFDKLRVGCLLRGVKKENTEPENIALGQISKELRYIQRHSQYATEIDRVLKELRLTAVLIEECRICKIPDGVTRQELLAYYQGNCLNLVHQIKDKIMQLINLMTEDEIPGKPDVEDDVSVLDLLKKKQKILQAIGIEEEIREWDQNHETSKIAVALRKRTHHHHRVSGLIYDKDFLNLGFVDIVSRPDFQEKLSDYGKERIENMRAESTERLFSGALLKARSTLVAIEENLEKISGAVVEHFKLPTSQEEVLAIMEENTNMPASFKVVNKSSRENIPKPYDMMLDALVGRMHETYGSKVEAVYLVGSLGRGEYEEGYSDINIYVILDIKDEVEQVMRQDENFSLTVFTIGQFRAEKSKKYRIIAKADGVLLYGTDLIKEEEVPKAGLLLALVLNDDIIETLDSAKKWIEVNPAASPLEISKKSRRLAKRILDFMYGVAMSNKPQYTASRRERIERILEQFPGRKVIDSLMAVTRYGVGDVSSFNVILDGSRPRAEANLKKMEEVKLAIEKNQPKGM